MVRTTALRLVPAVLCGSGLALALASPAIAQADPPGNNGTVKIDGVEFDDHPNNQPHVGCEFQVDFYGFDEGEDLTASVLFEAVPPTTSEADPPGGGEELLSDEVDIGEDEAGGGTDLDASAGYDLTEELAGITPHPQQGWHVRLTVHADGSQGADTKHKVFWVSGCGGSSTTTTTTPGSSSTTSTTAPGSSTTSTTTPETTTTTTPGVTVTTSPPSPSTSVSSSPSTTTAAAEGGLPITGSNTAPLVVGGAALILVGATGVVVARRYRLTGGR